MIPFGEASIGSVSALKRNSGCSARNLFDDFETFVRSREAVDVLSPRNTIFPRARGGGKGGGFNEGIVNYELFNDRRPKMEEAMNQ